MPEPTKKSAKRETRPERDAGPKSWPKMMEVDDVAKVLDVSSTAVRRLIASGKLKSLKIGGARKVAEHDLWVFLKQARNLGSKSDESASEPAAEAGPPARPSAAERTLQLPHVPSDAS